MAGSKIGVLFVCLGNICRSPAAEGTFRQLVSLRGLDPFFEIDSAGTSAFHVGDPPNANSSRVARKRGITLTGRSRQFVKADFVRFRYIAAMDRSNKSDILSLAGEQLPGDQVFLFRSFDPLHPGEPPDVPDPYYGGVDGFEEVQDIMERTASSFLDWLVEKHGLSGQVSGDASMRRGGKK